MKRRLVALQGYFGFSNTGDEAILHCALAELRELQKQRPYLDFVVFSENPELTTRIHDVRAVSAAVPTNLTDFLTRFLLPNRRAYLGSLRAFWSADTLMVGGGGLFFDHPQFNLWLRRGLTKIEWAKRLGKQVVILGVDVGPVHLEDSQTHLRKVLSMIDIITVRTAESRQLLDEIGVTGPPIHTTADFAYLLRPSPEERIAEILRDEKLPKGDRPRIGLCLHGSESAKPEAVAAMVGFCNYAIETLNADLWFVPMQFGGPFDDRPAARKVVELIKQRERAHLVEGQYWPWETQGVMAHCQAILGVRLHGVILAINNHQPVFGISYMPKVHRVFQELRQPDWQTPADGVTAEKVIEGFSRIWERRDEAAAKIAAAHAGFCQSARSNFALLAEKLDERYGRQKEAGHDLPLLLNRE